MERGAKYEEENSHKSQITLRYHSVSLKMRELVATDKKEEKTNRKRNNEVWDCDG